MKAKIELMGNIVTCHSSTMGGSYGKAVWVSDEKNEALMQVDMTVGQIRELDITDGEHVGDVIRGMRTTGGNPFTFSQVNLAMETNLSVGTVQNVESNANSPSLSNLGKILDALGYRLMIVPKE